MGTGAAATGQTESAEKTARFVALSKGNWLDVIRVNWTFNRDEYTSFELGFDAQAYWYLSVLSKFLLGFVIGRRKLLQNADQHLALFCRALPWTLAIGLLGNAYWAGAQCISDVWLPKHPSLWVVLSWLFVEFSALALSLAYLSALVLLFQRPAWRRSLEYLAPVGRMALTNYLMHSFFFAFLFYSVGLGLLGKVGATGCLLLGLAIFGFQIALSKWWLNRLRFGPVEWLWRSLTYGKIQPMRSAPVPDTSLR